MAAQSDFIKKDGMFKQLILKEDQARQVWEQKWGFTKNMLEEYKDSIKAEGISLDRPKEKKSVHKLNIPPLQLPSTLSLLRTSAGFVGWRPAGGPVENVGPLYISPKTTIQPSDFEDLNATQKCIFIA